jgi:hypothetical protein
LSYGRAPKLLDRREHYAPMPEQHADVLKVLIGQMAKCCETNPVFSKTLRVLGHAELFEPVGNLLHRGPLRILRYPLWTDRTESLPRRLIPAPAAKLHVRSGQSTDALEVILAVTGGELIISRLVFTKLVLITAHARKIDANRHMIANKPA